MFSQIESEIEILGYISATYPNIEKRFVYIKKLIIKYAEDGNRIAPRIEIHCLNNANSASLKIPNKTYDNNVFNAGQILYINKFQKKIRKKMENKQFIDVEGEYTWWIPSYSIISPKEFDEIINQ